VSGWGYTEASVIPSSLKVAPVDLVSREDCQTQMDTNNVKLYDGMLCAGGGKTDACQVISPFAIRFKRCRKTL